MARFVDEVIGLYHFLSDRAPKSSPLVDPKPRTVNPWCRGDQALISKVMASDDIGVSVDKSLALLGHIEQAIDRGDRVLIKPNLNSPDPYPGSTDLGFLRAVLELLTEAGARITIGESSGGIWRPTSNIFRKLGIPEFVRHFNVELIAFEDRVDDWVRVKVNGDYLHTVSMPRSAYEADKIVYLPCMRTHKIAGFSGALKLVVGFMHPGERRALHVRYLQSKIAEISLCWQPNLIIMDGRKAFVSGGPERGQLAEPGLILASGDLVAIDVEAMKVLLTYQARNKLAGDPWKSPQIVTALKHGLGGGKTGYIVVE